MRRQSPFGSALTVVFVIILAGASFVIGVELGRFLGAMRR